MSTALIHRLPGSRGRARLQSLELYKPGELALKKLVLAGNMSETVTVVELVAAFTGLDW